MFNSNPILKNLENYEKFTGDSDTYMSLQGTLTSIFILALLLVLSASVSWKWFIVGDMFKLQIGTTIGIFAAFIVALIINFKPALSPYLSLLYVFFEGIAIGGMSAIFESVFPHIVIQAVFATFITLFVMLLLYLSRIIVVDNKFVSTLIIATLSIFALYLISSILNLIGFPQISNLLWTPSLLGIGVTSFVTIVAAFNLILDFHLIEKFSLMESPKYMNWFCAFGLMVTLIWLYINFLRLLALVMKKR